MTTTARPGPTPVSGARRDDSAVPAIAGSSRLPRSVVALALLTAVLRVIYLRAPMSPDEGGFLMVARQWGPGPSLYGHYWVDRPPLLIALFRVADAAGGLIALRVLGCVVAALTVLGVGLAVRRLGTPLAATWAAAVTGGLLVSPVVGALPVNGELLAAPFIAFGTWLVVVATLAASPSAAVRAAAGAGACAAAAVLVKQNMLDTGVFAVVFALVSARVGLLGAKALGRLAAAFTAGGVAAGAAVLGGAMLMGTSPGAVLFAMYPFRLRASRVAEHSGLSGRIARLTSLGSEELASAGPVLVGALVVALVIVLRSRRRQPGAAWVPAAVAALVTAAYGTVSVLAGGSYWGHYLVELIVPTAMAAGLVTLLWPRIGRGLAVLALVASAVAWSAGISYHAESRGLEAGKAIGRVAQPGDTGVSALGDPDVLETAGLSSPYPYLWSLPARTLDPHFAKLSAVLSGQHAPTWLVLRNARTKSTLDTELTRHALRSSYHLVAQICSRSIYLHSGVHRPVPRQLGPCSRSMSGFFDPDDPSAEGSP